MISCCAAVMTLICLFSIQCTKSARRPYEWPIKELLVRQGSRVSRVCNIFDGIFPLLFLVRITHIRTAPSSASKPFLGRSCATAAEMAPPHILGTASASETPSLDCAGAAPTTFTRVSSDALTCAAMRRRSPALRSPTAPSAFAVRSRCEWPRRGWPCNRLLPPSLPPSPPPCPPPPRALPPLPRPPLPLGGPWQTVAATTSRREPREGEREADAYTRTALPAWPYKFSIAQRRPRVLKRRLRVLRVPAA